MLICSPVLELDRELMVKELLGKQFSLADATYSVTDVRNVDGETFVYAEIAADQSTVLDSGAKGPGRAAFRFVDIEQQFNEPQSSSTQPSPI